MQPNDNTWPVSSISLTKAIQFRQLIAQLTNKERSIFLQNILKSHVDIILTSLFQHLMHMQSEQFHTLNDFNNSLSDIIQARKDKKKTEFTGNCKLYQFPRHIIGYLASFLPQSDYCRFSVSNRGIYLGCNLPNVLQRLNLRLVDNYSSINLPSFSSIKHLAIDSCEWDHIKLKHTPIFNRVTTLTLDENNETGVWTQKFLNQNIINYNTVTALEFREFGNFSREMEGESFLRLLNTFPNIQRLQTLALNLVYVNGITANDIATICPNITGFHFHGDAGDMLKDDLILTFANQLKYLSFDEEPDHDLDLNANNYKFDQLEELRVITPSYQTVSGILQSASNLKKIHLAQCFYDYYNNDIEYWDDDNDIDEHCLMNGWMTNAEMKTVTTEVIINCSLITYMRFDVQLSDLRSILKGIECGLFKTKKQQRMELKIEVSVFNANKENTSDLAFYVDRVITLLESSAIHDFMFILQLKVERRDDDLLQSIFEDLSNICVHTKIFRHELKFVIANQNCKINGYRETVCALESN